MCPFLIRVLFCTETIYLFSIKFILNEISSSHFLTSEIFVKILSLESLATYHLETRKKILIVSEFDEFFLGHYVTPPTRHPVSSETAIFFPIYYKLINFKFVHSYNVKNLTCTILCSNGLQNIYKLHIWKCSTFTIFTLLTKETKIHIH